MTLSIQANEETIYFDWLIGNRDNHSAIKALVDYGLDHDDAERLVDEWASFYENAADDWQFGPRLGQ